ncbi:E3 ubiquitin-protein ligase MIB2-like [Patiria miniata]|uniref:RING-type E3 ubiquitin transferase n=1 Tax=Patiria miniata TaxID=46514 RepID=A0A914AEE1_PATMI|nr:E3 ubiquitin-protein ligase MIB2-like [Patiria miniata]
MFVGVRVVRGPDWKWGDQDGGKGCVGTVVPAQAKDSVKGVWVRWDSGQAANYRAGGASGKYDLRIYDNAQLERNQPVRVQHPTVICDCCQEEGIVGIRWKCLECRDFDLCHSCYNEGKHDLGHCFTRIETNSVPGIEVPCRFGATKCRSLGIFPGARVMRGPDWEWEDQDGGEGKVGTVSEVSGGEGTHRSWVAVKWPGRSTNKYRRGHEGKLDLQYTDKETMGEFYIEHLPRLDGTRVQPYLDSGDKVRLLDMDPLKLKELQLERCGWNEEITDFRGKVGEVIVVDTDGDVKVNFGGASFFINPLCLVMEKKKGAEESTASAGDTDVGELLAALLLKSQLGKLGDLFGGLADTSGGAALFQAAATGNTNKVREIINDHPDAVKFQTNKRETALQAASHRGHMDVVTALVKAKAPLEQQDEDGDRALAFAVLGDEPKIVKCLLQAGSIINAANNNGLTPLHLAAAKDHQTCVEVLLKHDKQKCDVNYKDKDGDSPLLFAISKNNKQIIHLLINHPRINLRQVNKKGFNSLHHAVFCQNSFAVEWILGNSPDMINVAKTDGFTALHIAATNGLDEVILILVKQANCNKELKNNDGQTALHLATNDTYNKCIEALVNNGANVNAQDSDGDTSLHLVMIEASMKDILRVTPLGQLMELVEQIDEDSSSDQRTNLVLIALYLIKNGADIYIKNKKGQNVLDLTLNPKVKQLLKTLFELKRSGETPKKRCTVS